MPVYGVVGMLEKVGTALVNEGVGVLFGHRVFVSLSFGAGADKEKQPEGLNQIGFDHSAKIGSVKDEEGISCLVFFSTCGFVLPLRLQLLKAVFGEKRTPERRAF